MEHQNQFDYIIVGGGLAGLQLTLALLENKEFDSSSIAVIEASQKDKNDKTWSFWEKGKGKWEELLHHEWKAANFYDTQEEHKLDLGEYTYKTIRSIDFYRHALQLIEKAPNAHWINDSISEIKNSSCIGNKGTYKGNTIFDSRVDTSFYQDKKNITILQHFKGWVIETEKEVFKPDEFTMMDFRLAYQNACCFTYVLPYTAKKALVEFTFFTPQVVENDTYDALLSKYISEQLNIENYIIQETEQGVIPMSTHPFHKENSSNYLKIGTAGGWVKASSGYSFKNTEKKVSRLIRNLIEKQPINKGLRSSKHELLDRIFLRVLENENELGNDLFIQMYSRNKAKEILEFLDEDSSFQKEFSIINSFNKSPFLRSLAKEIF